MAVMPDDDTTAPDDALSRRLDYLLTTLNILGGLMVLGYMVVAIDEMTGGALKREWEQRRDRWRAKRKSELAFWRDAQRVQFEAWRTLRETEEAEGDI